MPAERSGEVLVINTGSSSLKVELVPSRTKVTIERIGTTPAMLSNSREPDVILLPKGVKDHAHAFEIALARCSTESAPWYVVPGEKRWFRDLVVSQLLRETLEAMNPQYPEPDFDPADYPPESIT